MRIATVSIILVACVCMEALAAETAYVGKVLEVSDTRLVLEAPGGGLDIGFGAKNSALLSLHKIKVGQEVRAVFGAMRGSGGRKINELLTIRACLPHERECTRDRARMAREAEASERQFALYIRAQERCLKAMNVTLAGDARYMHNAGAPENKDAVAQLDALQGEEQACAQNMFKQHEDAFLEACEQHHCGDDIGGGCAHLERSALSAVAAEKVVASCRK